MRVLHVVKTTDGANWAVDQVSELVKLGIDIHVVLPDPDGRFFPDWEKSGARIHLLKVGLPFNSPSSFARMLRSIRELVSRISPDIIHSHFFNTTLALRYALGRNHKIPRLFQVPGPAHMEYGFFRRWELSTAGINDEWIASSRYTRNIYLRAGVPDEKVFLSYYGNRNRLLPTESAGLRTKYGIKENDFVVGNINYMYPPRFYLGQFKGIKRHEDVIDALSMLIARRRDVTGLIIGGQWGRGNRYEAKLKARADRRGKGRIIMAGLMAAQDAKQAWLDFDLAVHVPVSENCGGVVEPLLAGTPVIASRTGGLPEVVIPGRTGVLVPPDNPELLAVAIDGVLSDLARYRQMAADGCRLVKTMFDVKRTSAEVAEIYRNILDPSSQRPVAFDPTKFLDATGGAYELQ